MFIGNKLIYVELHKTGCTQIRTLLMDHVGGVLTNKHNMITHQTGTIPIVGSIRNPWDWYVSLWAYGCGEEGGVYDDTTAPDSPGLRLLPSNEVTRRKEAWRKVYSDAKKGENFRGWLDMVNDRDYRNDVDGLYAESSISRFAGLFTFRYVCLATPWHLLFEKEESGGFSGMEELSEFLDRHNMWTDVIRTESIPDDLVRILEDTGHGLSKQTKELIPFLSGRKINRSLHSDTIYYYDEKSIELIAERDKIIVDRFGYRPPEYREADN